MQESIKFSKEQQSILVDKLKQYFVNNLDYELGGFAAQFLLDFISDEIGLYFYNQGILDSQAILNSKIDDIQDAILQLEKMPHTR